jgi:hypothetical protein
VSSGRGNFDSETKALTRANDASSAVLTDEPLLGSGSRRLLWRYPRRSTTIRVRVVGVGLLLRLLVVVLLLALVVVLLIAILAMTSD